MQGVILLFKAKIKLTCDPKIPEEISKRGIILARDFSGVVEMIVFRADNLITMAHLDLQSECLGQQICNLQNRFLHYGRYDSF